MTDPGSPAECLPRVTSILEDGRRVGLHVGAQVFVSRNRRVVADFGWGEARPGVPMTAESVVLWMSSGKPIGAAAILQLVERGSLELHAPVARYIPEFAANGKETVTLFHLLTHTGGFRLVDIDWPTSSEDEIIARLCRAKLERDWTPGQRAGYHAYTSWYILGEVVRRTSGETFSDYVRRHIFRPLGMNDSWIGMPEEQFHAYGDRLGVMLQTDKAEPAPHRYSSLAGVTLCVPGGNAHGPARELGRFYEMLLAGGELDGARILTVESVRQMTARQRQGMFDETFRHVMDWGLGVIVNSSRYGADTVPYGFGPDASEETFGHGGAQSSLGFADPQRQLAVAIVINGMPGEAKHHARMQRLLPALWADLRLADRASSA